VRRGAPERSDGALAGAVSLSGSDRREAQLGFAVADAVDDEVGVGVGVGDGEAEGVGEGEAVWHAVGEGAVVADAVAVADADEDGVGVAQIGWRTALMAAATWL